MNINYYLNYFLAFYGFDAKEGMNINLLNKYMEEWYPQNVADISVKTITSMAASINKFYIWMNQAEAISDAELWVLKKSIKTNKPKWIQFQKDRDNLQQTAI